MEFKTEKEILLSMVAKAQEQELLGDIEDIVEQIDNGQRTENQYVLDLATHAYILSDFTKQLEQMYQGVDVATAQGEQLDRLGNLVNVHRLPGIAAQLNLELYIDASQLDDIVIPAGTEVLIDNLQVNPYVTYTTDSKVVIQAGSTSVSVTASSNLYALQQRVPAETTYGLEGFPTVHVYNREAGTRGRTIEEDDDYRRRILLWNVQNQVGTKAAFEAYLGAVNGLDDFKLIPQPYGVGTLTIVCDCTEETLITIRGEVQDKCMLFTDDPVDCVAPSPTDLDIEITATITRDPIQHTVSEIIELVQKEVESYIDGGNTRNGPVTAGLRIGEDFIPSKLVAHLHNQFPEFTSISCDTLETSNDDYHKFRCGDTTVVIE